MATTINGIVCQELREGFEEGVDSRGPHASKKFLCAWADRYAVANGLLGLSSGTGSGGPVTLSAPNQWPEALNMFVQEVTIEGRGKATDGAVQIEFTQAVVTANYGVPTWGYAPLPFMSIDPGQPFVYATQSIDFGREMITVEGSSCTLAGGGTFPASVPYAVPLPHAILTIQLQRVPYLPAQAILVAMGKPLNNATFLGVQPGYLMFNGCKSHAEAISDGTYTQNLTLVFSVRPVLRWDETFDPNGTSGPKQVLYNGLPILQRSNLATLIPSAYGGQGP